MGISLTFKEKETEEAHGDQAEEGEYDFNSKKELKNNVKGNFEHYECPECGGRRVTGNDVIIEFCKIRFFQQESKKGLFGVKYIDKHTKDVWRLNNIYLEPSSFLQSAGYIRCKSCQWEQKGEKGYTLISIHDLFTGNHS